MLMANSVTPHTKRQWAAAITVLAVAVRVGIAWHSYTPDLVFTAEAERIAKSIALRGEFSDPYIVATGPTAHCGPFYPALLSIVYMLCGMGKAALLVRIGLIILANALCCAILPAVAGAFGLPLWSGVAAGLAAAMIPVHRSAEMFNVWR